MNNKNASIFRLKKNLETSLHGEKRNDVNWLTTVLHDNFLEIGKSGYFYTKRMVADSLNAEVNTPSSIFSKNFKLQFLDTNVVLLTYQSYEISKTGGPYNKTLRSSIWQLSASGTWKLRFHQGTRMAN
ncbi:MAG: DUF4440 domain-containing protein [Enterobacteriaceae bacterium]|nr:DUF4440 domain-containing protein [Enterobacteriaceae bacterium]